MTKRKRTAGRPKGTKAKGKRGGLAPNQYLDDKQLARLLRYVSLEAEEARRWGRKRAVVNNIIVNILVYNGLRADELCKLNIRDLPSYHEKNQIFVCNGKGSISRTIDIPEALAKRLSRFVRLHRKGAKPDKPFLVGERGKRLSYRGLYSRIKSIGERTGLPELHPHTLRHTFGTRLYNLEHDLFYVQDQLGHKSTDTTKRYAKTNNTARRRQTEKMDMGID